MAGAERGGVPLMEWHFEKNESFARSLDDRDPIRKFRDRFHLPEGRGGKSALYFVGNSLGLQPRTVKTAVDQELADWSRMAIEGHFHGKHPWYPYHEFLSAPLARIVGALPTEVVAMNSLTVNLH